MERKEYKIEIKAPAEKVWNILWGKTSYPAWTSAFGEGSHVDTDWKKGSKAFFLDGKNEGMAAMIEDNRPNEYMSIKHLGLVKNGIEDIDSIEAQEWANSYENYTLKTINGKTELIVDMDIADDYKDYFEKTWPKALTKV